MLAIILFAHNRQKKSSAAATIPFSLNLAGFMIHAVVTTNEATLPTEIAILGYIFNTIATIDKGHYCRFHLPPKW